MVCCLVSRYSKSQEIDLDLNLNLSVFPNDAATLQVSFILWDKILSSCHSLSPSTTRLRRKHDTQELFETPLIKLRRFTQQKADRPCCNNLSERSLDRVNGEQECPTVIEDTFEMRSHSEVEKARANSCCMRERRGHITLQRLLWMPRSGSPSCDRGF